MVAVILVVHVSEAVEFRVRHQAKRTDLLSDLSWAVHWPIHSDIVCQRLPDSAFEAWEACRRPPIFSSWPSSLGIVREFYQALSDYIRRYNDVVRQPLLYNLRKITLTDWGWFSQTLLIWTKRVNSETTQYSCRNKQIRPPGSVCRLFSAKSASAVSGIQLF
jgi:hypothetical protein